MTSGKQKKNDFICCFFPFILIHDMIKTESLFFTTTFVSFCFWAASTPETGH